VIVSAWAAVEGRRVMVRRVEVPIAKLPAVLDGMSFVQLSDVHLGTTVGRRFMEAVVARANSNHEYHAGAMRWCAHLESLGVRVLRNELVPLERDGQVLQLAGTDDSDPAWRAEGFEEKLELAP
jgi:predicted MPP superfamily phosphohydrolase